MRRRYFRKVKEKEIQAVSPFDVMQPIQEYESLDLDR